MIEETGACAPPVIPPGSPRALAPVPPTQGKRVEWLFRDALRRRQVHPLMDLMRRYRGEDAT